MNKKFVYQVGNNKEVISYQIVSYHISYQHGDEPSVPVECTDLLWNCQLPKKNVTPWTQFCVLCDSWLCPCRLRTSAFSNAGPPACLPRPYLRAPSGRYRTRLPVLAGQHPDASCCPQANSSFCSQQATTLRLPLIRSFAVESQKLTLRGLLC